MSIETSTELGDQIATDFIAGNVVLKIKGVNRETGVERTVGMVITNEDFEKRLYSHKYNPILFMVSIHLRIAYLFGCLNLSFREPRKENFLVLYRKIKTDEWKLWFSVNSYYDSMYGEIIEKA